MDPRRKAMVAYVIGVIGFISSIILISIGADGWRNSVVAPMRDATLWKASSCIIDSVSNVTVPCPNYYPADWGIDEPYKYIAPSFIFAECWSLRIEVYINNSSKSHVMGSSFVHDARGSISTNTQDVDNAINELQVNQSFVCFVKDGYDGILIDKLLPKEWWVIGERRARDQLIENIAMTFCGIIVMFISLIGFYVHISTTISSVPEPV
jgi:hypothetical protein